MPKSEAQEPEKKADDKKLAPRPRFWPRPRLSSNDVITARNGGVRHQFLDDIGGCSANYR